MSTTVFSTPDAAEAAYIEAFQSGDLEAMMGVWAEDEDIVCTHPVAGAQQQGRNAVFEGWLSVFARELDVRVSLLKVRRMALGELAVHCGEEHVYRASDGSLRGINNFTNVYKRCGKGWRMIVHHASPGPASRPSPGMPPSDRPRGPLH